MKLINIVSPIFIVLFIVILYACLSTKGSFIDRLTDKISVLNIIFTTIGIYLTYTLFKSNQKMIKKTNTLQLIDRGWIRLNEVMHSDYKKCPNFIESLFFNWQVNDFTDTKNKTNLIDEWPSINYISMLIFQTWEDFLADIDIYDTRNYVWICNFISWCKSPILYKIWLTQYQNYTDDAILLGNIIFDNVRKNEFKNSEDIIKISKYITETDKFKNLLLKIQKSKDDHS